jgi:hypothetical protein
MTSKSFFRGFYAVYFSLVGIMTLFVGVTLYLTTAGEGRIEIDTQNALMLRYGLFVLTPSGAFAGFFIYKRLLASIEPSMLLVEKLTRLASLVLIRSAFLEFSGLAAAVATILTGDNSFLLFSAIMLVMLILYAPTVGRVAEDLRLSPEEVAILEKPDSVLK